MNKIPVILKLCGEKYDSSKFKLLHEQFEIIKNDNHFEKHKDVIKDVIHLIVEYLLYGETNDPNLFDLFCEYDLMNEFVFLAKQSNCRDINLEIINDVGMLVLNLKNEEALYYLFSNNYINQIISNGYEKYDDDFLSYYVNFLKSLSLKIDITTIQFFFHKQINSFPLIESAFKMYNHPDPMIKNVVRNIFLTISKLRFEPFYDYLCCLPSVSYFAFIACRLRDLTISLETLETFEKFKSMQEDIIDDIIYIQDIFSLRIIKINYILTNTLMYYYVMPLILGTLLSTNSMQISISLSLYILIVLFYYIKDESFLNALFYVVFSPTISKSMLKFMKEYPKDAKNYFFDWQKQKNQTSDTFHNYVEYHFSGPFMRSLVTMKNSPYKEILDLNNKFEEMQDKDPRYVPNHPHFLEIITTEVLNLYLNSEMSIMTTYHKNMSISTGVSCGISTYDIQYCFMIKLRKTFEKVSSLRTSKFITNEIRTVIYSFFKTKLDNLIILVNLLINVITHKDNLSFELLSYSKLLTSNQMLIFSKDNEWNGRPGSLKKYTKTDVDIPLINKSKSITSSDDFKNKNKLNKIKVSLREFVKNSEEKEIQMFTNSYLSSILTILHTDYDYDLIDSLIKNIITFTQNIIKKEHFSLLEKKFHNFIDKILKLFKKIESIANKSFNFFESDWEEYSKSLPIQEIITNSFLIAPYSFNKNNDNFSPMFNIVDEENIFVIYNIDLTTFMSLNDMVISLNKASREKLSLIKDKFPLGRHNLILEKEYNVVDLTMESYQCIIKNKNDSESKEYIMIISGNKLYFGLESKINSNYVLIKIKYSLSQIELSVDRADPRILSLIFFVSDDNFIETSCIFKDVDLTIRVKRNLEEHIKTAKYKEINLFEEYFTYLLQKYSSK